MSKINYVGNLITGMEAAMFIIPNRASSVGDDAWTSPKLIEWLEKLCELNNTTYDKENDKLVETWLVEIDDEKDDPCDNMQDHVFCLEPIKMESRIKFHYIPEKLIKDFKEGDTFKIKIPIKMFSEYRLDERNSKEAVLELSITANQKDYRYRRFGTFEECLEHVTR